jgi:putative acetyltransferase
MIIRQAESGDLTAIQRVHEQAFGRTGESRLVKALCASGKALISLVAVTEEYVIGHLLFSQVNIEIMPPGWRAVGLAPLAVLPAMQRRGIGSALVRAGLQACQADGYALVVVLGDHRYYSRFGFMLARDVGLGNEYQADEHFMALALQQGALQHVSGLVRYSGAFQDSGC